MWNIAFSGILALFAAMPFIFEKDEGSEKHEIS
jgi:hypothetical protein